MGATKRHWPQILLIAVVTVSSSSCKSRNNVEASTTKAVKEPPGVRVITTKRIPAGALITVNDVEKAETPGNMLWASNLSSPLCVVGRRARHNISAGTRLNRFDIWWEPRSAYEQSDLVQNEIKLALARWHEKHDLHEEEVYKNWINDEMARPYNFDGPQQKFYLPEDVRGYEKPPEAK